MWKEDITDISDCLLNPPFSKKSLVLMQIDEEKNMRKKLESANNKSTIYFESKAQI